METIDEEGAVEVHLRPYPLPAVPMRADTELRYEVTDGRVVVTIDGCARTFRAGEIFIVPAGHYHGVEASDPEPARVRRLPIT